MTSRLDTQRPPGLGRTHARKSDRLYVRGYDYRPHYVWGDGTAVMGPAATGANAGIPGTFTPTGATAPASPAAMAQANPVAVIPNPATAWTTGQYVQTLTAGAAGRASWSGTSWVSGAAP